MRAVRWHLWVVLGLGWWLGGCVGNGAGRPPVAIGELAPSLTFDSLDGQSIDSQSWAGRVVVVNFWATWCQACKRVIPELVAFAGQEGIEVVGIALDEEGASRVAPYVERSGIPYTVGLGDAGLFARFDGLTIPYTLVLDGEQRIVNIYRGSVGREALAADLARLRAPIAGPL